MENNEELLSSFSSGMQQLIDNNYVVIDDFLNPKDALELYEIFRKDSIDFPDMFFKDKQCPKSLSICNYRWFVEILVNSLPKLSKLVEHLLLPTFCYGRVYVNGDDLKKHKDRPSCELSVTLHLGSDGTEWPIYFTKPNGEVVSIDLKPGQAVVYLGMVSEHWRDVFTGEHYGQVFLHYVFSRGAYWDQAFDLPHVKYVKELEVKGLV